jgi:hypothetical protein
MREFFAPEPAGRLQRLHGDLLFAPLKCAKMAQGRLQQLSWIMVA